MQVVNEKTDSVKKEAHKLADFIMFTQRSFLLNLSKELNKGNVSYAQFFLLGYLANEDYLTMTDIANKMGHSTAAATGLVDRLEKLGYVQRLHAADDRRKVMVQITRKGIELVDKMRDDIVDDLVDVMAELDADAPGEIVENYGRLAGRLNG
ncbi:MAG: MarR family transcriptional regulator [Verrucomicrobiota bacterium]